MEREGREGSANKRNVKTKGKDIHVCVTGAYDVGQRLLRGQVHPGVSRGWVTVDTIEGRKREEVTRKEGIYVAPSDSSTNISV